MKVFIKSILILLILTNTSNADLLKPKPSFKPLDVLLIQLNSLKNNNSPYTDAGIEQAWEFAHPNNKIITGPLDKFKKMIYSESYKILISHENSEVSVLKKTENILIYKVIILSKDKKKYYYIWQVEKVLFDSEFKNCWMTTNVSNPNFIGDVI
tara:strand:- start:437 stop:898 length:462 start_codon:yes stop_codon:yes gene_type:complete